MFRKHTKRDNTIKDINGSDTKLNFINMLPTDPMNIVITNLDTLGKIKLSATCRFFNSSITKNPTFINEITGYKQYKKTELERCITSIIDAAKVGIRTYEGNNVGGKTGKERSRFYKMLLEVSDCTIFTKAVAIYSMLYIEGGKRLKNQITFNISKEIEKTQKEILKDKNILKNRIVTFHECNDEELNTLAEKIHVLKNQDNIKWLVAKSVNPGGSNEFAYFNNSDIADKNLIAELAKELILIQSSRTNQIKYNF